MKNTENDGTACAVYSLNAENLTVILATSKNYAEILRMSAE